MRLQKRERKKKNYMSVEQYASAVNVSRMAIYNRIEAGEIETEINEKETGYEFAVIDIDKYPVDKFATKKRGRKKLIRSVVAGILLLILSSCDEVSTPGPIENNVLMSVIDSCEYLYTNNYMVHKGNCNNPQHAR